MALDPPNPYEPPAPILSDLPALPDEDLVIIKTTKLTYGELRNLSANPIEFVLASIYKTLRIQAVTVVAFGRRIMLLSNDQVPERLTWLLKPLADEAKACGMKFVLWYTLPIVGTAEVICAVFQSADGHSLGSLVYARTWVGIRIFEKLRFSLVSRMQDGNLVITTSSKPELNNPSSLIVERMINQPVARILTRHEARLREYSVPSIPWTDRDDVAAFLTDHETKMTDYQRERGVYVAAPTSVLQRLRYRGESLPPPIELPRALLYARRFSFWMLLFAVLYDWFLPLNTASQSLFRLSIMLIGVFGLVITLILGIYLSRTQRTV